MTESFTAESLGEQHYDRIIYGRIIGGKKTIANTENNSAVNNSVNSPQK